MNDTRTDSFSFEVPLTLGNHQIAREFSQQHGDARKAKQVYVNTLSVFAVDFYLKCLGFETSLDRAQSWNPTLQVLADTADLWVENIGRLECRPVLPQMSNCTIPPQVWSDRVGYIFVKFDAELTVAELIGFASHVERETLSFERLQSLDRFPDYLNELTSTSPTVSGVLSNWLNNLVDAGWKSIEAIVEGFQTPELAFNFRNPEAALDRIEPMPEGVKQGKFVTLGDDADNRMLFLVGIAPTEELSEFNITVELYPFEPHAYLPRALQMAVLDDAGNSVLQADGSQSEGLEFQFSGEPGERFSIRIGLNDINVTEVFEI